MFFGAADEDVTKLYCRDLATKQRTLVAELSDLVPASLVSSQDGEVLIYSRRREIDRYIDDPFYQFPSRLSILYRMDVSSGETEELFDFSIEPWRTYRDDQHMPFISPDGTRAYILAYDIDRLSLNRQVSDWLAVAADLSQRGEEMDEQELSDTLTGLRDYLVSGYIAPRFEELAVEPAAEGEITDIEQEAMEEIQRQTSGARAALLIWDDGEPRLLPLNFAEGRDYLYHYIVAAGNQTVLLVAPDTAADPILPQPIYTVDLDTGEVTEALAAEGSLSAIELDATEQNLQLIVNPVDAESREVLTTTELHTVPLDGGTTEVTSLLGDFLGFANLTTDGRIVVGQDRDDLDLYRVDLDAGTRVLLKKLMTEIGSIFVSDDARHLIYSDSGVLFQLDLPAEPAADPAWITDDYAAAHLQDTIAFFRTLGFDVPDSLESDWEERRGLGAHEYAFELRNPEQLGTTALVRYLADEGRVASVWFPGGYPFEIDAELQGSDMDYYNVEALAEVALDRAGWLQGGTRSVYQPGPNPLYDARSDSYIVIFRDGYWLGSGADEEWAYSREATLRIRASDGLIAEMTLSELEPVMNQPREIPMERASYNIRNFEDRPIPEEAPIRIDTEHRRLVVHQQRLDHWTDQGYELALVDRLCYEIDTFIMPEDALIYTTLIDTETGKVLGEISFQPTNVR